VLVLLVTVFPIYWMVATGFKRGPDILSFEPKWLPIPGTLENYRSADRPSPTSSRTSATRWWS
jgi:N,N'-diacetylchitobiose transport system permease protein